MNGRLVEMKFGLFPTSEYSNGNKNVTTTTTCACDCFPIGLKSARNYVHDVTRNIDNVEFNILPTSTDRRIIF